MKTIVKTLLVLTLTFLFVPDNMYAQGPPPWAPAHGYRAKARHIYYPEYNFYYDTAHRNYIYLEGNRWAVRASLPKLFIGVNLGNSRYVEIDYRGNDPYRYNDSHRVSYTRYPKYRDDDYGYKKINKHKKNKNAYYANSYHKKQHKK